MFTNQTGLPAKPATFDWETQLEIEAAPKKTGATRRITTT
jgi:hypothetical protein